MAAFGFGESLDMAFDAGDKLFGQGWVHELRVPHEVEQAVEGSEAEVNWRSGYVQLHLFAVRAMGVSEGEMMQRCLMAQFGAEMVDHHCFCTAAGKSIVRDHR